MLQSPLNYTGGKHRLLPQILPYFPDNINTFVDLFCGGCNVGINVSAKKYIYNDYNEDLIGLFKVMKKRRPDEFIHQVEAVIQKYQLSDVKKNGYAFYHCSSNSGLSPYNREKYLRLRTDFNQMTEHDDTYYLYLYVLIIYSFNNQIRFNRKGEFNLPPGKRDFNQRMYDKLSAFLEALKGQQAEFFNDDFSELDLNSLTSDDFVYCDPPYLIMCASYNEQNRWTEVQERALLELLDRLHQNKIRFALSNVMESKGETNFILEQWLKERPDYRVIDLAYSYNNANYHRQKRDQVTREVLIMNDK